MIGSARPVIYDVTRLVTRALNLTPNGIDRVDFAFARHFLSESSSENLALVCTALGPRIAPAAVAAQSIAGIEEHWNESIDAGDDPVYEALINAVRSGTAPVAGTRRLKRFPLSAVTENWRAFWRWALRLGAPVREAPSNAIYINASQFLLDKNWFLHWLDHRPDVKPLFFVHDLLPIERPEFFRAAESERHILRMLNIAHRAAGVVVGSQTVAHSFQDFVAQNKRAAPPLCVAHLPVSPSFATKIAPDPRVVDECCFVMCGTIEPRKNHLMLLHVWRELASAGGRKTPKLIIVGKRGWNNEHVIDMLDRCEALRPHVIEASGLSTPGLRQLLAGARALLMPSFAEGFGLPVAEAIAAGVPVIASDIEVFREIGGGALDLVDPLDGAAWRDCILDYSTPASSRRARALSRLSGAKTRGCAEFLSDVQNFVAAL